jgi:hypothetical protein
MGKVKDELPFIDVTFFTDDALESEAGDTDAIELLTEEITTKLVEISSGADGGMSSESMTNGELMSKLKEWKCSSKADSPLLGFVDLMLADLEELGVLDSSEGTNVHGLSKKNAEELLHFFVVALCVMI